MAAPSGEISVVSPNFRHFTFYRKFGGYTWTLAFFTTSLSLESVNITVSAEIAEVIYDSRRMEHASNERSRYHTAFSLDSEDYEGTNLVSEKTPDDLMEELEDREHLLDCLAHLSENQRQRILMLAQGMSITEIARVQHADRTTVRESIQAARKKFKKYF